MSAQEEKPVTQVEETLQSRGEKKARKAIVGLGLKPVAGVNRVTFTRGQGMVFSINNPEVFKSTNSDTHIVFGEMQVEDMNARAQAALAEQMAAEAETKGDESTEADAEAAPAAAEEEEGDVDATGCKEEDIETVMSQANTSRAKAIGALKKNDQDIVNSIMDLTM